MRKRKLKIFGLAIAALFVSLSLVSFVNQSNNALKAEESNSKVEILNTNNFDDEISEGIVLVDFWATWCRPCRIQGPIVEDLADEVGEGVTIAKLDVDKNRAVSSKYRVRSIPTIIIFKDGKPVERLVGVQQKSKLKSLIKKHQ